MDVVNKFLQELDKNSNENINHVKSILSSLKVEDEVKLEDVLTFSNIDLKNIIKYYAPNNGDQLYTELSSCLLTCKIYSKVLNSSNEKLKKAKKSLENFAKNLNDFINNKVKNDFSSYFEDGKLVKQILDFDDFENQLSKLDLTFKEKGELKKVIGISNISLVKNNHDLDFDDDKRLFKEVEDILDKEKDLIDKVSLDDIENLKDEKDFKVVSVLTALYSECEKAKMNVSEKKSYNLSIKLIKEYLDTYYKLVKDDKE